MLNKKILTSLFMVFVITSYEEVYAHGAGGGDVSYEIDKIDKAADREAEKKTAEKQADDETWDEFMKEVKRQEKESITDEATKK